ncbi:uncharacterized protein N7529_011098 [Penicillium soppii]|uniref:uncharacterized protein n=1 Tax=Penicillium soppii TaxID=69789 RepID=UPI002547A7F4|nr:uncharacterized protein N7529_011098 [Penicillium soppii]KAJ5851713.1 hypothetical protein N7529_011098 [Penicillium soppii]
MSICSLYVPFYPSDIIWGPLPRPNVNLHRLTDLAKIFKAYNVGLDVAHVADAWRKCFQSQSIAATWDKAMEFCF